MGIGASIGTTLDQQSHDNDRRSNSSYNVANSWMDFSITTHSHYKYHRAHVNISMPIVESFLTRQISIIRIQVSPTGFHFLSCV